MPSPRCAVLALALLVVAAGIGGCDAEAAPVETMPEPVVAPPETTVPAAEPEPARPVAAPAAPACEATSVRPKHVALVVTPDDGDARVVALLEQAKTSIDVTIYQLSSRRILDALEAAAARGVRVRIIQDQGEARPARLSELRDAGVDVKTSSKTFRFTHQKTVVVDAAAAFVFSGNLDRLSFGSGRNYGVIDDDADDVADLEELFEADWAERTPELTCTRLVVAPVNARARVLSLVATAAKTLDVEAMYITDDEVMDAVLAAHHRGVVVRVLLNDPSHDIGGSEEAIAAFAADGIVVRRSGPLFIHAKLIVADGKRAFVGSENFSGNSLDRNREAGLVVSADDSDLSRITTTFAADWTQSLAF